MLPGKKYTAEDLPGLARRRIWVVLVPLALVSAGTAAVAQFLPDRYRAETSILVVPQRVPESYVKPTVTTRIEDRLQSITQQILSRTRLERIIHDFNLYAEERRTGLMEDVVQRMRRDVTVEIVKGDAFRVAYIGSVPSVVVKVTDRLASLFIEENLRDREVLAEGTSQFLQAQLDDARARLITQEEKLAAYRKKFAGQLPSQLDSNLQVIHNTELRIQALTDSVNRDRDRRLGVVRMLADLTAPVPEPAVQASDQGDVDDAAAAAAAPGTIAEQLDLARSRLTAMQVRFTPEHPDVIALERIIETLEQKLAADPLALSPVARSSSRVASDPARDRRIAELRAEVEQLDQDIARRQSDEQQLRATVAEYQNRVEAVPGRESELAELTRDYATLQSLYTNLLTKKEESIVAANLERRQIGEQFKLLDAARLPEKPFRPNRALIALFGLAGGLCIGIGLAAMLEYRDSTFRTDHETSLALGLPVLAAISPIGSKAERRRRFALRFVMNLTCGAIVIAGFAVVVVSLVR